MKRRLLLCSLIPAATLTATLTAAGFPEAISPTNTLPPTAGQYELWPPTALVEWKFTLTVDETNFPCQFDLERITAAAFTNLVRTQLGNDQLLEFDAVMATDVPYMRLGEYEYEKMALSDQLGHLRVRVVEGAQRSTGAFALGIEAFSWTLRGHDAEGQWFDLIHVRLREAPASTGGKANRASCSTTRTSARATVRRR